MIGRDMPEPNAIVPSSAAGRGPLRNLIDDRRGATAAFFGVALTVVVGFAGLATEAGRWYDIRRDMQNAADVSAMAGALRLQMAFAGLKQTITDSRTQARAAATDVATRNGYTTATTGMITTVTPNAPPASGAFTGAERAVEVVIERQQPRLISRLFLGAADQPIQVRGVAAVQVVGPACILALQGGLTFSGNVDVRGPDCIFASNSSDADSIRINGNPYVQAETFVSLGGCTNCNRATLDSPPMRGASDDPFAWASSVPLPTVFSGFTQPPNSIGNGSTWTSGPMNTTNWNPDGSASPSPYYAFTGNVGVGNGETLILNSGTYFFTNGASLDVNGGNICLISCSSTAPSSLDPNIGVTLVFLKGSSASPGNVKLTGNGTIRLQAPSTGPYRGLLLYRQQPNPHQIGQSNDVIINGTNNSNRIAGGIYVPGADLEFLGTADVAEQGCLVLVGGKVYAGGNSTAAVSTCNILSPNLAPQIRVVRLVE